MTSDSPAHDFLLPRLGALLSQAVSNGFSREVAVAVMIDVVTSPAFNTAAPDPLDDSAPHMLWNRGPESLVLVAGVSPVGPIAPDAQDEADFLRPNDGVSPS